MINKYMIDETEMEKLYEGPLTGPYSSISDYLYEQKESRTAKKFMEHVFQGGYCGPGVTVPTQEYVDIYSLGYGENVNGIVAYYIDRQKDNISVFFMGKKRIKRKFLEGLAQEYKKKLEEEISFSKGQAKRNFREGLQIMGIKREFSLANWFRKTK
ncbi:MAG: hypothetical protein PHH54_07320 [Candidatus Nanoarchaeia archaeon]|nr:hypothetical protein [Candidatus Nanoarchaeia archaeon]MDD5741765.1 hypothetical protein [Candidatus Nanoarchaeia archaeon]